MVSLGVVLGTGTSRAQQIVNGSMTGTADVHVFNQTPPPGWDDGGTTVDTFDATSSVINTTWESSADGGTFVHAGGADGPAFFGEWVQQAVTGLVPGETYTISFEQTCSNTNYGTQDTHGYFEVCFGAQTQDSDLVAVPPLYSSASWQPQSMQFTASSTTELLTFTAKPGSGCCLVAVHMGLDGVKICPSSVCDVPQRRLYTVTNDNVLARVDVDNGCSTTLVGVTQDTPSGPIRKLRGLEYLETSDALFGMTREGDLVRVNRFTGATVHLLQLPFGNPGSEFWGGLAFDGVDTLYTTNATDSRELVAIDVNSLATTLIGSTVDSGGSPHQILGVALYPTSAPPSGLPDPVPGVLYGVSRLTQGIVRIDTNTAIVSPVGGNFGVAKPQALSFHPDDGTAYSLEDHVSGGNAGLATYDFNAFQGSLYCGLPFGITDPTGNPIFGWGGLAAVPHSPWSNEGCALAGIAGDPLLTGFGSLQEGSANTITLSNAAPGALAVRFIAPSSTPIPVFGGVLKPYPFVSPLIATTSISGSYPFAFVMPPGVPSNMQIWVQWAIQDGAAINGIALSNALLGLTP